MPDPACHSGSAPPRFRWRAETFDDSRYALYAQSVGPISIYPVRGSTLHNSLVIIEEAQNFTPHQMKTLLTRAGRNTRIFITGDPDQIDNRFLTRRSCGLTHVIGKMRGHDIFARINLTQGERSEIATLAADLL